MSATSDSSESVVLIRMSAGMIRPCAGMGSLRLPVETDSTEDSSSESTVKLDPPSPPLNLELLQSFAYI